MSITPIHAEFSVMRQIENGCALVLAFPTPDFLPSTKTKPTRITAIGVFSSGVLGQGL